jgi:hypothetical protein
MRSVEEYIKILDLHKTGNNHGQIAKQLNIPRTTVRDFLKIKSNIVPKNKVPLPIEDEAFRKNYAYFLGIFLGDGCLSLGKKNVYRCRITLDAKYSDIISKTKNCISTIMPNNKTSIVYRPYKGMPSCVDVSCYSKEWIKVLTFYIAGPKWTHSIKLEDWQQSIVEKYPHEFWLGLYHSDGTRYVQTNTGKFVYSFCQKSEDITNLFKWCSDLLDIKYTSYKRDNMYNIVGFYSRASVSFIDTFAGQKT